MSIVDKAYDILTANKSTGSVILSWSYDAQGKGVVVMGRKDPLSLTGTRTEIINAWENQDGLDKLATLGITL